MGLSLTAKDLLRNWRSIAKLTLASTYYRPFTMLPWHSVGTQIDERVVIIQMLGLYGYGVRNWELQPTVPADVLAPRGAKTSYVQKWQHIIECRYNTVQYYTTLHTSLQRLGLNISDNLSNFKAIRQFKVPISWLRDFTRSCGKTSFRILRRGPELIYFKDSIILDYKFHIKYL